MSEDNDQETDIVPVTPPDTGQEIEIIGLTDDDGFFVDIASIPELADIVASFRGNGIEMEEVTEAKPDHGLSIFDHNFDELRENAEARGDDIITLKNGAEIALAENNSLIALNLAGAALLENMNGLTQMAFAEQIRQGDLSISDDGSKGFLSL